MNIERLEPRVAPATLTGQVLTYTDIDGDRVTLTISKGTLTPGIFTFDTGSVNGDNSAPQQLRVINLNTVVDVTGANILMTVVKVGAGDGLAAVGSINATGRNLGTVTLKGDLGDFEAGSGGGNATIAAKAITVRSTGAYGLTTQGGVGNLQWNIQGSIGSLKVAGDIKDNHIAIFGILGPLTVGGSIIGGDSLFAGSVGTIGGFGPIKIGKDIRGGTGFGSGLISTANNIASVTIGGSLIGGSGEESGEVRSEGNMGPVKIGGDIRGGDGTISGHIDVFGNLASLTVGGSIVGGRGGQFSTAGHEGQVYAVGNIGPVKVARDMIGGIGGASGQVRSHGSFASMTLGGSLIGGGFAAGQIASEGAMGPIKIGGFIVGGTDAFSGIIHSYTSTVSIKIGSSIIGGASTIGGYIQCEAAVGSITIGGSLLGTLDSTGAIFGGADVGPIKIGGTLQGGTGESSGVISITGKLASLTIGGSLAGGTGANNSGSVFAGGNTGPIKIGRDFVGGNLATGGTDIDRSGFIQSGGRIQSVIIGGSIVAGVDQSTTGVLIRNAGIHAGDDIGFLKVKGNVLGNAAPNGPTRVFIGARGMETPTVAKDLAIGKITIGGRVEYADIVAGNDPLFTTNGNAQIGPVSVGGDWYASSIAAGVNDVMGNGYGNADDAILDGLASISKIASITIKGTVVGSSTTGDHFGFVSHSIGSFKSIGYVAPFSGGADIIELSPITADVSIREI